MARLDGNVTQMSGGARGQGEAEARLWGRSCCRMRAATSPGRGRDRRWRDAIGAPSGHPLGANLLLHHHNPSRMLPRGGLGF
jgi:hypothetical protein